MSDHERLSGYVDVWWRAIEDLLHLLESLDADQWRLPTDLEGWDVHAVACHVGHLESLLAGNPHEDVEIGEPGHVRSPMGTFTEQGVVARRDRGPDQMVNEIRACSTARHTALVAEPPEDGRAPAPGLFGAIGWDTETLLRNRPLDIWMHEQDVRRAVGIPGNMDAPAAGHTVDYLLESLGYVLAKRVGAPEGTTLVVQVEGSEPAAFTVNEDGRGAPLADVPDQPTVRLATDRESFVLLAGGRRPVAEDAVRVEGDEALGRRIVSSMAVTP
jgi:uncharacterized protein (TIGR03083 family)